MKVNLRTPHRAVASFGTLLLLTACKLSPNFKQPNPEMPVSWVASSPDPVASVPSSDALRPDWWAAFGDPQLTALEEQVARRNLDVQTATQQLLESRAQRRSTASEALPQLTGDASYERQLPSAKGIFGLLGGSGGSSGGGSGLASGIPSSGGLSSFDLYEYGFDTSWELDLWGRVSRSVEAADSNIDASQEARRDILVSSLAEVAQDYIQLRGVQTELRIARDDLQATQDNLRLVRERTAVGLDTQLDAASAEAQKDSAAGALPQLEQQEAQLIDQLGILIDEPPGALTQALSTPRPIPVTPPQIPLGLPSELARRRPDIREAEAKLHAATADVGVAVASFYPSISFSGNFDLQALQFKDLGNWAARSYGFGPSLSLPIFDGGRLKGNLELSRGQQQEAAIAYHRTVLQAWQEVADALVSFEKEQERAASFALSVSANQHALDLSRDRYRKGFTPFLQVLTAEQQLLSAEQQATQSKTTISTDLVALYKALGGGWEKAYPREVAAGRPYTKLR